MDFTSVKILFYSAVCGVGGIISSAFGGWSAAMTTLIIIMAIDYITGIAVAAIFKKSRKTNNGALDSKAGFIGLCKKGTTLLIVLVASQLDKVIGSEFIRDAVVIGFIANETVSIAENAGLMGIPMPKQITKAIEILKTKSDE